MEGAQNVLVVEVAQALFDKMAPVLQRQDFEVDRFPDAARALDLVTLVPFTAIVVAFPLRQVPLERFLEVVREGESALASVAVLVEPPHRASAQAFLGNGVDLVLDAENAPQEMQRLLCTLLGVSPRAAMRIMVKLELRLEPRLSGDRFMAQTEDVSSSGMLVITKRRYPMGSTARFEMALPDGSGVVTGEADVARLTEPGLDRIEGIGFRFTAFDGDGQVRLQRCLERLGIGR